MEYYIIIHSSAEIKTVGDLLKKSSGIFFKIPIKEFLNYTDINGKTNLSQIQAKYIGDEVTINANLPDELKQLKVGTLLIIPKQKAIKTNLVLEGGIKTRSISDTIFKSKALKRLESDRDYIKSYINYSSSVDSLINYMPDISVWIWCRALSNANLPDLQGQLIDVSMFIKSVTTNCVGDTGGNFSIALPPLLCEQDENGIWSLSTNSISYNTDKQGKIEYISNLNLNTYSQDNLNNVIETTKFFFHNVIKSNDVVFIRFETLKIEERDRITSEMKIALSQQSLPGKIYDMIGLVDSNTQQINFSATNITTTIIGRDLTKLLIDEGSYFFPTEFANVGVQISSAIDPVKRNLRLPNDGALFYFTAFGSPTIEDSLRFILNNLTSVKVVPDSLFQYYKNNNLSFREIQDEDNLSTSNIITKIKSQEFQNNLKSREIFKAQAIEIIRRIRFNTGRSDILPALRFGTTTQGQENIVGYIPSTTVIEEELKTFNTLVKYVSAAYKEGLAIPGIGIIPPFTFKGKKVQKTNQIPPDIFSELYVLNEQKTYYTLDNRDLKLLLTVIDYVATGSNQSTFEKNLHKSKGIWSIMNLNIDPEVANRVVIDSSLATANGSILNFIRKVCQKPFVEFFGDTYGDQYYFTVRKPPFDKSSLRSLILNEGKNVEIVNKEETTTIATSLTSIIEILPDVVIAESLSMNESEIYTWYQLTPQNLQYGQDNDLALIYLSIRGFQEYIDIWGNKPYQLQYNYGIYNPNLSAENPILLSEIEKQAYLDLMFMIETTAYLPFTRKGTITIAGGDRRLKKGNFLRYYTDEIFYIEGVQHNYSVDDIGTINRTTTVQVSRGMVKNYIIGEEINGILYSYFDIINTNINLGKTKQVNRTVAKTSTVTNSINNDSISIDFSQQSKIIATKVSKKFIEILKSKGKEGFSDIPYPDGERKLASGHIKQLYSIGYGHQILDSESRKYTSKYRMTIKEAVDILINRDIPEREKVVRNLFPNVNQNQFDALFDFIYGTAKSIEGFKKKFPTFIGLIKKYLNTPTRENLTILGRYWQQLAITIGGKLAAGKSGKDGLVRRRREQFELFANNQGIYTSETFRTFTEETIIKQETTNITETVFDREDVLSNLKVNPKVFNFFLQGSQFGNGQLRKNRK